MKTNQRKRLEHVIEQINSHDDYCPQGFIVGIDVAHSRYGRGKVISLKKDICTVQFYANASKTEVPINHLLNATHQWKPDHDELSSAKDAYERDFAYVKRKYKLICAVRQSIMKEILSFERGVVPELRTSVLQLVWMHDKAMRDNKREPVRTV